MPLNSMGPLLSETGERFPVAAVVEPDADHDGFGDETQDQCPGVAGPINGCPPPQPPPTPDKTPPGLTESARSATLSKSGAISFFVTSNENSTGTATGTISVPKLAKTVRFAKRNVTLTAGKRAKLTLKLSKSDAVLVRMALHGGFHLFGGLHDFEGQAHHAGVNPKLVHRADPVGVHRDQGDRFPLG